MYRLIAAATACMVLSSPSLAQQPMPMPGKEMPAKDLPSTDMPGQKMPGKEMGPAMTMSPDMSLLQPNAADPPATAGYKAAMMHMMMDMPKFTGDADSDFMIQMRPHHQAAIDMAKVVLTNGKDGETKKLAQEIIAAQEKEIAMIDGWLKTKGVAR
jgi:uncharacterized protein (DUF305 family)